MIARIWHGATPKSKADAYLQYVRETGVKDYRATEGNRGVFVLRQMDGNKAHFLLLSLWDSLDAIRRFAGPRHEKAIYYEEDDDYLLKREATVDHYEVLVAPESRASDAGSGRAPLIPGAASCSLSANMTSSAKTPDPKGILEEGRSLRSFIVDLTLRISRERTVNYLPEDFSGGGPDGMTSPGQEGKVVAILAEELKKLGIPFTTHAKEKGRDSLLASVGKGLPGYRKLLVLLHTDTVPSGAASDWKFAPFEPFEKDGKLFGRGVLDDKGPLVASLAALRILKAHEEQVPGSFIFGAVCDEEVGTDIGLPFLIEQKLIDCTDAVIPDIAGNMMEINVAEKGRVLLKVRARGRQAHAMEPSKGVSAVHAMARFLVALEKSSLAHRPHPVLGGPTINAGLIRGGVAPNAVPADCETSLDIRFVPGQTAEGIRDEIQAIADAAIGGPGGIAGAKMEVEILLTAHPCEVSPDAPIVQRLLRHAPGARVIGSGGGTFAKDLVLMGVDAVGWAPGDEETYHQPNEEIEIEQLVTYAGRLANLAFEITGEKQEKK